MEQRQHRRAEMRVGAHFTMTPRLPGLRLIVMEAQTCPDPMAGAAMCTVSMRRSGKGARGSMSCMAAGLVGGGSSDLTGILSMRPSIRIRVFTRHMTGRSAGGTGVIRIRNTIPM